MKSLRTTLLGCALLVGGSWQLALAANDWVLLDENPDSAFSYDKGTVTRSGEGGATVTTRVVYTEKGREAAVKILQASGPLVKLSESRYTYDIDCGAKQSRLLKVMHLDSGGAVLKSSDLSGVTKWQEIPPHSRMERVEDMVCSDYAPPRR